MSKSKVLFMMTGSIACYKACHVVSRLVQAGCEVQVVMTPAALKFVGNATLEGLTGKPVVSDMYTQGNVMDHIHLMRWANLILVAPATANFINKAAQGIGDDLVSTLFLAHDFKKPFLLAPAMNTSMYLHPVTQKSISALKSYGIEILDSASGILACGEDGYGKLLDPDEILKITLAHLHKAAPMAEASAVAVAQRSSELSKIKVLITAGGTQEPIDTVRTITNLSSGRTGISLAEYMSQMGFDVTLIQAHGTAKAEHVSHRDYFTSFASLDTQLKKYLSENEFTHVIHAAAVSDYSVDSIEVDGKKYRPLEVKKVSSDSESMNVHLKRNHKIVDRLKDYSKNKNVKVVAFKLTSHATDEQKKAAVEKLFKASHADFVVHNDLTDIDIVNRTHKFTLYNHQSFVSCESLDQLTSELIRVMLPKDSV
ncbi:bifunctional phosphopantothenoylcysteine decarboxylase/phosphopantothenate--cysteine ligase CoaBC [Bdellovibrio sp. SKB1291214]|uniref:bifunctional phosphopantothenoylcysteine decarboxylase/phosphopantothenate--cysteine ligase CoaBC n=1 Tax=Bdellovibrio sp. SKB1291214 TaxID=1732569 RepID=UPI000B515D9D|nr:bifunctional phosphopantothenoylcysteine decarboxylase/phosphopantothenate--cysteine ligase CoaBC [Bdellovibrio sp. SKB1291214]UYL08629.1 bifunctional phosphopantothenoylcysteine decarboxylase/phosphopantothenate--cysteine ligase CoaBC [Bdellovibrio sp. SKB1291214]